MGTLSPTSCPGIHGLGQGGKKMGLLAAELGSEGVYYLKPGWGTQQKVLGLLWGKDPRTERVLGPREGLAH